MGGPGGGIGSYLLAQTAPKEGLPRLATPEAPMAYTVDTGYQGSAEPFEAQQANLDDYTAQPEPNERIKELKPRLRDALIKALHGVLAFRHVNERNEILPIVRAHLRKAGNDIFGPGRISAVLVQGMSRRVPDGG